MENSELSIIQYADDTTLLVGDKKNASDLVSSIVQKFRSIEVWCSQNKLQNKKYTTRCSTMDRYHISESTKLLKVIADEYLNWIHHIDP